MNKIGHRATALLLCVVLLFGLSISAGARENQCIDNYDVKASVLGKGKISVEISLTGTEPMQELGAKMIVVNEKQSDGNYYDYKKLYDKKFPDACSKKAEAGKYGLGVGAACGAMLYKNSWVMDNKYPW